MKSALIFALLVLCACLCCFCSGPQDSDGRRNSKKSRRRGEKRNRTPSCDAARRERKLLRVLLLHSLNLIYEQRIMNRPSLASLDFQAILHYNQKFTTVQSPLPVNETSNGQPSKSLAPPNSSSSSSSSRSIVDEPQNVTLSVAKIEVDKYSGEANLVWHAEGTCFNMDLIFLSDGEGGLILNEFLLSRENRNNFAARNIIPPLYYPHIGLRSLLSEAVRWCSANVSSYSAPATPPLTIINAAMMIKYLERICELFDSSLINAPKLLYPKQELYIPFNLHCDKELDGHAVSVVVIDLILGMKPDTPHLKRYWMVFEKLSNQFDAARRIFNNHYPKQAPPIINLWSSLHSALTEQERVLFKKIAEAQVEDDYMLTAISTLAYHVLQTVTQPGRQHVLDGYKSCPPLFVSQNLCALVHANYYRHYRGQPLLELDYEKLWTGDAASLEILTKEYNGMCAALCKKYSLSTVSKEAIILYMMDIIVFLRNSNNTDGVSTSSPCSYPSLSLLVQAEKTVNTSQVDPTGPFNSDGIKSAGSKRRPKLFESDDEESLSPPFKKQRKIVNTDGFEQGFDEISELGKESEAYEYLFDRDEDDETTEDAEPAECVEMLVSEKLFEMLRAAVQSARQKLVIGRSVPLPDLPTIPLIVYAAHLCECITTGTIVEPSVDVSILWDKYAQKGVSQICKAALGSAEDMSVQDFVMQICHKLEVFSTGQ